MVTRINGLVCFLYIIRRKEMFKKIQAAFLSLVFLFAIGFSCSAVNASNTPNNTEQVKVIKRININTDVKEKRSFWDKLTDGISDVVSALIYGTVAVAGVTGIVFGLDAFLKKTSAGSIFGDGEKETPASKVFDGFISGMRIIVDNR